MSVSACLCCEATSGSEDELAAAARPLLSAPPVRLSSAARPAAFVRSTVLKFDPLSVLCGAPLDRAARALGAEWLAGSGAPALRAQSAQTYESYQHEVSVRVFSFRSIRCQTQSIEFIFCHGYLDSRSTVAGR